VRARPDRCSSKQLRPRTTLVEQSKYRFKSLNLTSPTPATMPTTVYGAGARGRITDAYFAARGFKTLALMDAADKAIVDAAVSAGGESTISVAVLSYATAVPLPTAKTGGYVQAPAFEVATLDGSGRPNPRSFFVHADALATDPAAPPTAPAAAPAHPAAASAKREPVVLAKTFEAHDDAKWFEKSMNRALDTKGWAGATQAQIAEQVLANINKDIAAGLVTDGAHTMDASGIYALLAELPATHNAAVRRQMEVARAKCTDSEDFVAFTQNLLRRIVTAYGFETIAEWVASSQTAGHEEWVCQTIINCLAHAAPPRLYGVVTAQMDALTTVTNVTELRAKRAELLKLGNTNADLRNTDNGATRATDVFTTSTRVLAIDTTPPATTMAEIATALAALAATVEELKLAKRSRSSKFDPARHTLCKKCDGKGVANAGERPGEHLSYKCPGKP
jgi:hypothetical protein